MPKLWRYFIYDLLRRLVLSSAILWFSVGYQFVLVLFVSITATIAYREIGPCE